MDEKPSDQRAWLTLEKVVNSSLDEQRKARRWSIFFKLLTFIFGQTKYLEAKWKVLSGLS